MHLRYFYKFVFVVFLSFFFLSPFFLKKFTLGFKIGRVFLFSDQNYENLQNTAPSSDVLQILGQNFLYLDKGVQCYVFESSDRKYVLKLFRRNSRVFKKKNVQKALKTFVSSCSLAWQKIPNQTGLVYVHLQKTAGLFGYVNVSSPLGKCFQVDLDDCIFVVQQKVKTFKDAFWDDLNSDDDAALKSKISSYFNSLNNRIEKGIDNFDSKLEENFGFFENHFVEIDVGSFRQKELDLNKEKNKYFFLLKEWMQKNCPQKLFLLEDENIFKIDP